MVALEPLSAGPAADRMATSARAQKEAYLRRKGVKAPRPPTPEPAFVEEPEENVHRDLSPRKRERRPSFAEKRKAALLSRARGGRPRQVDIGMTAVLFAARLRISASHTKDAQAQQETGSGDTSADERAEAVKLFRGSLSPMRYLPKSRANHYSDRR